MNENTEPVTELESLDGLDDLDGIEGVSDFDSAHYLRSKESIAAFLNQAWMSGDLEHFKQALSTAARAEGMAKIAEGAGVTREGAYKALKLGSKPQMSTIVGILGALGMGIQIVPLAARDDSCVLAA